MAASTHVNDTTRFVYEFIPVKQITRVICHFQDECLGNPAMARFVAQDISTISDWLESGFVNRIIGDLGLRLKTILENVVNVRRFEMVKLAPNFGVDLEVRAYRWNDTQPAVSLPIEAKKYIGLVLATTPDLGLEGLLRNINGLRDICAGVT
ncbi:hypothetical protein GGH12_006155, partial [Coemansia sp. RSA 1822]